MIPPPGRRRRALALLGAVSVAGVALAWAADPDDAAVEPPSDSWTLAPHRGIGAWVDVYDWTDEFTGGDPPVQLDDIDRMAELGIETVYVQTAHSSSAARGVIERGRLEGLIDRAHQRDMHVVAWYLPPLVDVEADLARLVASAELPVDGLGVDIEAIEVTDSADRNARLLDLTARLRTVVGADKALAAITPSPVHLQVVNPAFWPGFPWAEVAEAYDVLLPMSYWSIREEALRDGEEYVTDDIARVRMSTGDPDVPIHVIGGIADTLPAAQVAGMVRAIEDRGVLGGSLYDWETSTDEQWGEMAPLAGR